MRYKSTYAVFKRVHKSRFSNGFVDNSTNVLIHKQIDSFLSYQLVEADLLKCMPALGDRIQVRFDEIDKTLRAYIIFQQHPKTPKNCFSTQLATYSKRR